MTLTVFATVPSPAPLSGSLSGAFSPLVLADRLISLAQEADVAGLHDSASRLIGLVYAVLDDQDAPMGA